MSTIGLTSKSTVTPATAKGRTPLVGLRSQFVAHAYAVAVGHRLVDRARCLASTACPGCGVGRRSRRGSAGRSPARSSLSDCTRTSMVSSLPGSSAPPPTAARGGAAHDAGKAPHLRHERRVQRRQHLVALQRRRRDEDVGLKHVVEPAHHGLPEAADHDADADDHAHGHHQRGHRHRRAAERARDGARGHALDHAASG